MIAGSAAPSRPRAAGLLLRVFRIVRASLHLVQGLATIAFVFPFVSPATRETLIRRWSRRLVTICGLRALVHGALHEDRSRGLVLVANHVSWLDIFVINAIQPAHFIAKADLARWPVIGWLIRGVGTLFIDRSSRRHVHEANRRIADALAKGEVIAIFPEGAVTRELQHFHGSLLQPAIDGAAPVQPIAIRYCDVTGASSTIPHYADVSFMASLWRIAGARDLQVRVTVAPAVATRGQHRGELAQAAERIIRSALE